MVQAPWALTLLLLLVALPAQDVGAALWRARAVGLEQEAAQEEAPEEGWQAVPGPGESPGAFHKTEYQVGRGKSSKKTPKVLHEILRELKMVQRGVNSLRLGSTVSRRSPSTGDTTAEPNSVDYEAEPNAVVGRADPDVVDADSFQKYCVEGIVAVLGSMLLGMVLCCVLHIWRKRRK